MTISKYVVAACALLPTTSYAQTLPCEADNSCIVIADLKRTDIVVTATGAEQAPETSGRAITLLNRAAIDSRQQPAIAELLAQTPGITISRNGGPGQTSAVRIRGAEDSHTLVLIDGVRVNDPGTPAGSFDFSNLVTGNINSIEVLRGPNSVPWGSAAIGGVVNIVTDNSSGIRARAEYGSRNSTQLVGQAATNIGAFTASLGGGYFRDDGISAYVGGRERDPFERWATNGRLRGDIGDLSLDLRGWYSDSTVGYDGFPPPSFTFADTRQYSKSKQFGGYFGANLTTGSIDHSLAFTIGDTARDNFDPDNSFNIFLSRGRSERIEYRGDASLGALRAVFGAEHEWTRFRDKTKRYSTHATSGYLQAIVDASDALTLTGGVRVDDYKTYGTHATLNGNIAWQAGVNTIIRAAYGEGFKAPTLYQLYSVYGNATLRPETARSYEIGIDQSLLNGAFRFGVTAFHRDTTNQIDFKGLSAPPFGVYVNRGRSRAEGFESFVTLKPSQNWTLGANYTFTDSRDRASNMHLLRRPLHSLNASIDWAGPVKLGADLRVVSDSRDLDFRTFAPVNLDGYALVTLRASAPIRDGIELYGRVENLFDARYETVSGYGVTGASVYGGVRVAF